MDFMFFGSFTLANATVHLSKVVRAVIWSRMADAKTVDPGPYLSRGKGNK